MCTKWDNQCSEHLEGLMYSEDIVHLIVACIFNMSKPCHIPLEYRYPVMKIGHVRPTYFSYVSTEDLLKYECEMYLKGAFVIFLT